MDTGWNSCNFLMFMRSVECMQFVTPYLFRMQSSKLLDFNSLSLQSLRGLDTMVS